MQVKSKKWLVCAKCNRTDNSYGFYIGTYESMHCPDCEKEPKGRATLCRKCCPTKHGTDWNEKEA